MKLLMCLKCGDIFNLTKKLKSCGCGETTGLYVDNLNAEIKGNCQTIGFANNSFREGFFMQKLEDESQKSLFVLMAFHLMPSLSLKTQHL